MASDLKSWMRKQNIYDNDIFDILTSQGIEDPTEDFADYTQNDWDEAWRKAVVARGKGLKDQKAKLRLEKKMKKIEKYWRQQSGIKITSIKKRKGKKKKKKKKKKQDPKSATNIEMQQNIEHGTLSDDEIEEYVTIKINVKSLKYNKLNDKYSMTLGDCMISENNPLRQIVKIEIDGKHIDTNISNDSNQLSSNEIDTVLDEIEMDENALKFDTKRIALNVNDKLLICGFARHIQESAVVSDDVIGVITVYIHSGNYANNLVTVGIGGGGCRLLHEMYNNQYLEYESISSDPSYKYTKIASNASCYFDINNENKCKAKSIFIDLEQKVVDKIFAFDKQRDDVSIYNMSNSCVGIGSASNSYMIGHYFLGGEVIDETMDIIRSQLEKNGIPTAFQIMHSMAGGTGGGLGAFIIHKCRDLNIKVPIHLFSLFPSMWQAAGMQFKHWPINVILALGTMNDNIDGAIAIDFDCLFKICSDKFNMSQPKGQDLNFVAYQAISDIISLSPMSYTDMFKYLCPKPSDIEWESGWERERYYYSEKMKYYTVSHVPIYAQYTEYGRKHHNPYNINTYKNKMIEMSNIDTFGNTNTNQIISKLFDDEYNFSSHFKIGQGTNISTVMIHRGQNLETQKEKILKASQRMLRRKTNCMNNIPLNLFINSAPMFTGRNATMVSNSTTIGKYFERIYEHFMKLWRTNMYHNLEGMGDWDIDQASENVRSIIDSYNKNHN